MKNDRAAAACGRTGPPGRIRMLRYAAAAAATLALVAAASAGAAPRHTATKAKDTSRVATLLGLTQAKGSASVDGLQAARRILGGLSPAAATLGGPLIATGLPDSISSKAPFSAALATNILGTDSHVTQSALLGNWNGQDSFIADHSGGVLDCGAVSPPLPCAAGATLTRSAISEHTIANGFNENIYYVGDSVGNVHVLANSTGGSIATAGFTINLPTSLNAFGTLQSDSHIVVTGLAVNPVADLTSFSNVNGSFTAFTGVLGEMLYVSYLDTGSGLRLFSNGQVVRSGVLAFPVSDATSPAPSPPGVISPNAFPVTVGGSFGVVFTPFSIVGGIAIDDDGSLYFHQADLINFTGGNIVKITSLDTPTGGTPWQDRSLATNGFVTITTLNPAGGNYAGSSGPAKQVNRATNFSGTSPFFGNVAAIAAGPGGTLYAAVAASHSGGKLANTQGPFTNPSGIGPTPSMVISLSDYKPGAAGSLPGADGFADTVDGSNTVNPGVNNIRAFVLGSGPKSKLKLAGKALKVDPFQVDYSVFSGLAVDQANTVFAVSGGSPTGAGLNPSPSLGEVLAFPDTNPYDRRADVIDFGRGDTVPVPGALAGSNFDGDSDRYDHIYWQAPLDGVTLSPEGIAGLSTGFLRYLNRTAPNTITNLPNGVMQADDSTNGPIEFNAFDTTITLPLPPNPGCAGQVAGGDRCNSPFVASNDGFDFEFGGPQTSPMKTFFLNSNGSISFGSGDTTATPTASGFASGPGRIAGAWADLNPASRAAFENTFPVQAAGYAAPHEFTVRWINVPETGGEATNSRNTFSISLFDDGTGIDDPFNHVEGPRAPRHVDKYGTALPTSCSGFISLDYAGMDLLGNNPVAVGYSTGGLGSPSGAKDLGDTGRKKLLGTGSESMLYELFDTGNFDFDLRGEGANTIAATPTFQHDKNREHLVFRGKYCT